MKVKIKPNIITDQFNIIRYVGNDLLAQESYEKLKGIEQRNNKIREIVEIHSIKTREIIKKQKTLQYKYFDEIVDDEQIDEQIKLANEEELLNKESKKIKNEQDKISKELDNLVTDFQLKTELKHRADNIVKKLKRKIHCLSEDKHLIDEIVKEENMKFTDFPIHINIGNVDVYYFIEPIIDFSVTDKITITDFKVCPFVLERDFRKIIN